MSDVSHPNAAAGRWIFHYTDADGFKAIGSQRIWMTSMIGGTDIILPVTDAETAMDLAIRAALRLWPRPIFEDADTGETFLNYRDVILAGRPEILVYRDVAAQAGWKELGADESLDGTMIHLIARGGELTIAVDDVPNPLVH